MEEVILSEARDAYRHPQFQCGVVAAQAAAGCNRQSGRHAANRCQGRMAWWPAWRRSFLLASVALFLSGAVFAQAPAKPRPTNPPPQTQQAGPEHHITPEEAKQLLDALDEVLKFDSKDSALPIKHEVKRRLASREEVQNYIEQRLRDDPDAERLKNGEVVLKKLGLLPRDFDLDSFLVELLKEQVAGYYDPKTKVVNLLDWLGPEAQLPVMAHELTHALQDQSYGLEKWVRGDTKQSEVVSDESMAARQAVVEGQAMAVMMNWILAPTGQSLLSAPQLADAMEAGMASGASSPVFDRAPLYLQRVLLFPYTYGLDFERALLTKGGKERAYGGVFQQPPASTREVMEPNVYLAGEKLPPLLPPPELEKVFGNDWEKYDVGAIGEFDVAVMAEQLADRAGAKKMYPNWRGGYYYAVRKRGADAKVPDNIGLVFVTRWAAPAAAREFGELYSKGVPKRYANAAPSGADPGSLAMWRTPAGGISVAAAGDIMIAVESFAPELHERIRNVALKAANPSTK